MSFHPSYWDPRKTDRRTNCAYLFPQRTNHVSFHPSYWNLSKIPDRHTTVHFIPHIGIYARQTDKLQFISSLTLESTQDRQTTFHFTPHFFALIDRQTDKLGFISPFIFGSNAEGRTNYVSFHPSYLDKSKTDGHTFLIPHIGVHVRQTDGQTMDHFTTHVEIQVRQTYKLHLISPVILESKQDKRTNYVTFYPSYLDKSKTDGQTFLIPHIGVHVRRQTDGQTMDHFTPHVAIQVRQTYKLHLISPGLILESKQDRRTN